MWVLVDRLLASLHLLQPDFTQFFVYIVHLRRFLLQHFDLVEDKLVLRERGQAHLLCLLLRKLFEDLVVEVREMLAEKKVLLLLLRKV